MPHTIRRAPTHTNHEHAGPKHESVHNAHNKRDTTVGSCSRMRITPHISDTLATCSARAAADSAAAGPIVSSLSRTLIDLRKGRCELGTRANTNRTLLLPTERLQQWSVPDGIAWRASAFDLAWATHLQPHVDVFILKPMRACFQTASKKTSKKASIDLDRRQTAVRAMRRNLGGLPM